jgi:hypothetical protein
MTDFLPRIGGAAATPKPKPMRLSASAAISTHRAWTRAVELFDSVGLVAPKNGSRFTVRELDGQMSALGLDHDTQMNVKTAAIVCRLL